MKLVKKTLALTVAAAGLAAGAMDSARADAFAQSILVIDNFRLLHSNGDAFNASDFGLLRGANDAQVSAQLNGVFADAAQSLGLLAPASPDLAHQGVGSPVAARAENDFTPFASAAPVPGTFGYADQNMTGQAIVIGTAPAGARTQTRAAASLAMNGSASGNANIGTATTFSFSLGAGDTMTIAFEGTPFTQAYVAAGSGTTTAASARLSWSINIIDLTTGSSVFAYQPLELNALASASRSDGMAGTTLYDPGTFIFSATTPLLNTSDTYQMTIQHETLANALQAVPEPGTLAVFGLGLLGIAALGRRRPR